MSKLYTDQIPDCAWDQVELLDRLDDYTTEWKVRCICDKRELEGIGVYVHNELDNVEEVEVVDYCE